MVHRKTDLFDRFQKTRTVHLAFLIGGKEFKLFLVPDEEKQIHDFEEIAKPLNDNS
jgi:hypothetical protein